MAGGIFVDLEGYIKDHYWSGWWFDRPCLYEHLFDSECGLCQEGTWYYTSVDKTNMNRFGDRINDDEIGKSRWSYGYGHYTKVKKK